MRKIVPLLICLSAIACAVTFARADERSDAYYDAIADAITAGNFSTADSLLNEWRNAGIDPVERIFSEGFVAYRRGQTELGKELIDSAINLSPKRLDYRTRQIREQYLAGRKDEAFEGIRKLAAETAKNPTDWVIENEQIDIPAGEAVCLLMSSHLYHHLSHLMQSADLRQFADSVIATYPEDGVVNINTALGYGLYENDDKAEAIEAWEQALTKAHQPELSHLRALLASCYGETGDIQRYSDMVKLILDDPESDPEILEYMGLNADVKVDTLSYSQLQFIVMSYFACPLAPEWITDNLEHPEIILPQYLVGMNFESERDITCIKAEKFDVEVNDGDSTAIIPVIVWTMPEPHNIIDCKYVAYLPDGDKWRYITLEKTLSMEDFTKSFVVCEAIFRDDTQGYDHLNYGIMTDDAVTADLFSRLAAHVAFELSSRSGEKSNSVD